MTFSQYAGIAIIPTLSRLVLCAVFVSAGYSKVFTTEEVDGKTATQMKNMGFTVTPKASTPTIVFGERDQHGEWQIVRASYRQDSSSPQTAPAISQPVQTPVVPATAPDISTTIAPKPADTVVVPAAPVELTGTYTVGGVYHLAFMLEQNGFKLPRTMAWVAALTELIGGALLLIGMFSRVWGLGLAIAMGVAFYLVSMQMNHIHLMSPWEWGAASNRMAFSTAVVQVTLFILAFGIFLTGPGPLSIDRFLFGGSRQEVEVEVVETRK